MSTKISQLTSAVDVTANDLIQIVDVEDGVMAPSGTNKKATASLLAKELAKQPLEPGVVISGSSSSDAVRITQTGAGNALVVEDFTNPDGNPFIIANNGNVAIGSTIAPNDALKVRRTGNENAVFSVDSETGVNYIVQNKFSSDGNGSSFQFRKYRGSIGSLASAQNNDTIGTLDALGYDGANIVYSAQISAHVDGTPGTNDMPGRLVFSTTADGASSPTERMRIDSAGNVGIGTSSPANKLVLNTSVQYDGLVLKNGTNTVGYITGNTANNDDGQLSLNSGGTNVVSLRANGASFLNGGNVGIGTSTPTAKLHVSIDAAAGEIGILSKNTSTAQDAGATQALVGPSTTSSRITHYNVNSSGSEGAFAIQKGNSTGGFAATIADYLYSSDIWRFFTAAVERMRIDSAGNVGIGTSTPSAKLHISSSGTGWPTGLLLENTTAASKFALSTRNDLSSPARFSISNETVLAEWLSMLASNGYVGLGVLNPSYQLQLSLDSAAKPSTSTWTVSSDERLKENIEAADLDICYNAVKNIPLKRYKWKDEIYSAEQVADRNKIGWIAQDVQAVFPKAVGQHKFVYNQVKDEEGNIVSEDSIDDCLSLNSDQLYAALFGAVQKLMGEVESLQDRIAELESAP